MTNTLGRHGDIVDAARGHWKAELAMFMHIVGFIVAISTSLIAASTTQSSPQTASQSDQPSAFDQCMDKAETNLDFSECTGAELKRQETRLAQAWKLAYGAMKEVSAEAQKLLLEEQRAWIRYKDAGCLYYRDDFGREGQVIHMGVCRAAVIDRRVEELKGIAEFLKAGGE